LVEGGAPDLIGLDREIVLLSPLLQLVGDDVFSLGEEIPGEELDRFVLVVSEDDSATAACTGQSRTTEKGHHDYDQYYDAESVQKGMSLSSLLRNIGIFLFALAGRSSHIS